MQRRFSTLATRVAPSADAGAGSCPTRPAQPVRGPERSGRRRRAELRQPGPLAQAGADAVALAAVMRVEVVEQGGDRAGVPPGEEFERPGRPLTPSFIAASAPSGVHTP